MDLLQKNREFWTHERSLTALLIYLTLAIFTSITLSGIRWWEFVIRDILFNLILLSGVFAVFTKWRHLSFFILTAVIAFVLRILSWTTTPAWIEVLSNTIMSLFLGLLAWMVLHHIYKDGPVNKYRIQGSLVVYLIMGLLWAQMYHSAWLIDPSSFGGPEVIESSPRAFAEFIYFSFVTLTTLGYGDIVPEVSLVRAAVIFEGMTGMLYPVLMIARLVALELQHSRS
ncbi:MAG TPA: hypothetical protein DCE81_10575 [Cytophagales bacterium]|nr:hypothetical protein [Cytophagales bacterium]